GPLVGSPRPRWAGPGAARSHVGQSLRARSCRGPGRNPTCRATPGRGSEARPPARRSPQGREVPGSCRRPTRSASPLGSLWIARSEMVMALRQQAGSLGPEQASLSWEACPRDAAPRILRPSARLSDPGDDGSQGHWHVRQTVGEGRAHVANDCDIFGPEGPEWNRNQPTSTEREPPDTPYAPNDCPR